MTLPIKRKRSQAAKDRDEAIYRAAIDLFLRKGISDTRVEEILAASGASVGSFYYRYESKIELAAFMYVDIIENFYADFLKEAKKYKDAEHLVKGMINYYFAWASANVSLFAYEFFGRTPEVVVASQPREKIIRMTFSESLYKIVSPMIASNEMREIQPEHLIALWLGPAELLLHSTFARSGYDIVECEAIVKRTVKSATAVLCDAAWETLRGLDN